MALRRTSGRRTNNWTNGSLFTIPIKGAVTTHYPHDGARRPSVRPPLVQQSSCAGIVYGHRDCLQREGEGCGIDDRFAIEFTEYIFENIHQRALGFIAAGTTRDGPPTPPSCGVHRLRNDLCERHVPVVIRGLIIRHVVRIFVTNSVMEF